MRKLFLFGLLLAVSLFQLPQNVLAQQADDVLMQGFYWNVHPGDVTDQTSGIWWDTLATVAGELKYAGFETVWVPSPVKSFAGVWDMGYGPYDYYDLGTLDQKFAVRTRFGAETQLRNMVTAFQTAGLKSMVDVVLNHRAGGDAMEPVDCGVGDSWSVFTPLSGRFNGDKTDFHPNSHAGHCNTDWPYHTKLFFEDFCYFHGQDNTLDAGWYAGPHNLGHAGDSLIVWSRWLMDDVGFDEVRLDAVKHIEPGFMAPFLVELNNGAQPFAVGEFFDEDMGVVQAYHDQVANFNSSFGSGGQDADLALFDFNLQGAIKSFANDGSGGFNMWDLNSRGLVRHGLPASSVVTFVENHDKDRGGFVGASEGEAGAFQYGNSWLKLHFEDDHAPVFQDKDMAYALIMAGEGTPTVFWKDYFWYGLQDDIKWQMNLRRFFATGGSTPVSGLNAFFPSGSHGGDLFVLRRDGGLLTLNDNPSVTMEVWVDAPFSNTELRDYSDAHLFETTEVFGDGRTLVKANARNYAWFAPTGYYPISSGADASAFTMTAATGGKVHFVALRASDAANLIINGSPIAVGDELAVVDMAGVNAAGMARHGQSFKWDGVHDMIIEVISDPAGGGLVDGSNFQVMVFDASEGTYISANISTWLSNGSAFNFSADRPNSRGGSTPFSVNVNNDSGQFTTGGISVITGFAANDAALAIETDEKDDLKETDVETPSTWSLDQNYPNPFNPTTNITFDAPIDGRVKLQVFDVTGRLVQTLVDGNVSAGRHTVSWNATDESGSAVANGIYIYRLTAASGKQITRQMHLLK